MKAADHMMQPSEAIEIKIHDKVEGPETKPYSVKAPKQTFFRQYYSQIITGIEVLIDFFTVFASFLLARFIYEALGLVKDTELWSRSLDNLALVQVTVACGITIIVFQLMGLYTRRTSSLLNIDEMRKLFRSVLLLAALVFAISFYLRIPFSRMLVTIWMSAILLLMSIEKMMIYKVHQFFHLKGLNVKHILIYGAGEIGRKIYKKIYIFPKLGYRAVGFLDDDLDSFTAELERVGANGRYIPKLLGTSNDLERVVRDCQVDELIIARKGLSSEEISHLVSRCRDINIAFRIIPQILERDFIEDLSLQDIGGIPLISEKETRVGPLQLLVKRVMDIVLSLATLILLWPVYLVISILIRIDSPGPAIFKHKRVGKDGREFTIYKFRTMHLEADHYSTCPKDMSDPRISRVGKYLRKTSLDELPQFFNVLRGEMAIVGPRPEMSFIVAQYNQLHRKRLAMKPGITGLWQISADRGEEIHANIDYDLYYVENYSILLDVAIILRTFLYALVAMKTA